MRAFLLMLVSLFVTVLSLGCTTDSTTDVTVPPPVASLSVQPTYAAIQVGTSTKLSAIALDSSGGTLTGRATAWSSSDQSVARVIREVGVVIGVAPGSADVIANAEGKSARARITVTSDPPSPPTLTQLVLTPASLTLAPGATGQFAVSGTWSDSSSTVPTVTYSATGGTITSGGSYTAGSVAGSYRVIATQTGGTLADTSAVTITSPGPTLVAVVLTPASIALQTGATQQFAVSARMSDGSTTAVNVAYTASGGNITSGGFYTAGTVAGSYRVIATQTGGTLADTSAVTITLPSPTLVAVVLTPPSVTLQSGATQQFAATGRMSDGSTTTVNVTYSATGGTITSGGFYTAGTVAGSYGVIATQTGGTLADTSAVTITLPNPTTLRQLAAARGLLMGSEVDMRYFPTDLKYQQLLAAQYNSVVAGNSMKFANIHPAATTYAFDEADRFVAFAQANGQAIHGHTLVWNQSLPAWVTGGTWTKATLLAVLKDHIATVVGRYQGKVVSWDVVNEVVYPNGTLGSNPTWIWQRVIGPEFIDSAFVWANRADPAAKLYLNGADIESPNIRSDSTLALVKRLKSRGVPIDGVGFESHFTTSRSPAYPADEFPGASALRANFARYAAAGFLVRVSELDVKVADTASAAALDAQAIIYRDVLDACLLLGTQCGGFTSWGCTDRESWIPNWYPGFGRALPFDVNYQPKPALYALVARLQQP